MTDYLLEPHNTTLKWKPVSKEVRILSISDKRAEIDWDRTINQSSFKVKCTNCGKKTRMNKLLHSSEYDIASLHFRDTEAHITKQDDTYIWHPEKSSHFHSMLYCSKECKAANTI